MTKERLSNCSTMVETLGPRVGAPRARSSTVEQGTFNPLVPGSNPGGLTRTSPRYIARAPSLPRDIDLFWSELAERHRLDHAPLVSIGKACRARVGPAAHRRPAILHAS